MIKKERQSDRVSLEHSSLRHILQVWKSYTIRLVPALHHQSPLPTFSTPVIHPQRLQHMYPEDKKKQHLGG